MKRLALVALLLAGAAPVAAQQADPLAEGFRAPPPDARPLAYWQWINGNVSEEGIRLDLEWMRRSGMGGVFLFDIAFGSPPIPQYVEKRIGFGTPEWRHAVRVAAEAAKRLDLSFGAQSSGGWSVSGDPGVTAAQAMKKLVWSETIVGPGKGRIVLPPPPRVSGPYQDLAIADRFRQPELGDDVAVLAYRLSPAEATAPRVTISGARDSALLGDGRYDAATTLAPVGGRAELVFRFDRAVAPGAFTLAVDGAIPAGTVRDATGRIRATLPGTAQKAAPVRSFALPGHASREWRVAFEGLTAPLNIREARFAVGPRLDRVEEQAGFGTLLDYTAVRTGTARATPAGAVLDLTSKLAPDGTLDWRPPAGRWAVLRFGWSLTGRRSVPASAESVGLEVDKLDADAVRGYATRFYDRYVDAVGPNGRMDVAITDSWEAGQQSWSPGLFAAFRRLRGYDPLPWLPAIAGRVVGDSAQSERFLADWRRTIADLIADNHYGVFAQVLRARGLTYYAEAPGTDLPTVADGIQAKARADVPMGEYWYWPEGGAPKPEHIADIREAASAAHLHGKPLVAAEALTTMGDEPWGTGPREWRRPVDRFFAEGVNRIVMHTSAHQPFTDGRRPGMTLRQYGQHFTRNEAWADLADGWVSYLSRASFLLQQGSPAADLAVFYGEEAPVGPPHGYPRPEGYDYDFLDAETLARLTVDRGAIVTPGGARYRVLAIAPGVRRMSVATLRALDRLAAQGAMLSGAPPVAPVGLGDDAREFARLRAALWGRAGPIRNDATPGAALARAGVRPDVAGARLDWTHRRLADGDVYFLSNPAATPFDGEVTLRAEGGGTVAEVWNAEDGSRAPLASVRSAEGARLRVALPGYGSRFVVVRSQGAAVAHPLPARAQLALGGPWQVHFLDGMGAPAQTTFESLHSWAQDADPAIRYYSGRARYVRSFDLPDGFDPASAEIDLGVLGDMARVIVNGRDLGVVWWHPARLSLAGSLQKGRNRVEILVGNYWQNRLIGDRQPGAAPQTFAPIAPYDATSPLRPAGLIGPVEIR
ncbi:glycosyl hydrolase [Sphingomonas hengshuiensis]|uniref:glycosyl hydrolase n=1 Tax=Sphingomonas hengshuiensis TaxID=1609977 RepID=UPI0005CAB77B|nr:glycosyl hydrolase [Sphingomonas hengshuiensis]